jgi:hypothetical protein
MNSPEAYSERTDLVIFSLDSRILNKISIASALHLLTSKAIGNWIGLGVKRYRILNFI